VIGIVAVAAVYIVMSWRNLPETNTSSSTINAQNNEAMEQRFEQQFCGTNTTANSNSYIGEVSLHA
jgi:hypothetical protein